MTNLSHLSPAVLRRMEKIAVAEEKKHQAKVDAVKEQILAKQSQLHKATYGSNQDSTTLMEVQGHRCLVSTNGTSRVSKITPLTQEVFDAMETNEKAVIQQGAPVLYQRLINRDLKNEPKSDKYYELLAGGQDMPFDLFDKMAEHKDTNDAGAWERYSSVEARQRGITKEMEALNYEYSVDNISNLNGEIRQLENQLTELQGE
ncbi:hypothetical protein [Bacillus cereus]|uniref:hypothetical protein n=1 Tax=Bacillus cereus TaxID=1396 RepID=UPI00065B89B3|nr:hypothetical protein [Bacillus cereus]KMP96504.1 hypothetical protein TU67_24990 [Bacillus cereus]